MDFQNEYKVSARERHFDVVDPGVRLYDAFWVLALALNNTNAMVESANISGTGCENVTGSLVKLENFTYGNEMMGCLIQWNLQMTDFSGVSVSQYHTVYIGTV